VFSVLFGARFLALQLSLGVSSFRGYMKVFMTSIIVYNTYLSALGKHHVDAYIKEVGLPACFLYTGNFYENMIFRQHVRYNKDTQVIEFQQPIIKEDTKCLFLSQLVGLY
jgi:hypothetical protein